MKLKKFNIIFVFILLLSLNFVVGTEFDYINNATAYDLNMGTIVGGYSITDLNNGILSAGAGSGVAYGSANDGGSLGLNFDSNVSINRIGFTNMTDQSGNVYACDFEIFIGNISFYNGSYDGGVAIGLNVSVGNISSDNISMVFDFATTPQIGLGEFFAYGEIIQDTNFTITLKDNYTNNSLINFNASIVADNGTSVYSDNGTGTIVTDWINQEGNITNITIIKENYFNSTYLNYNISTNLDASIIGTNVTLRIVYNNTNITANVSNSTLTDLNNSLNWTSSTGYYNINPYPNEPITFNIACNRSVFEERNFTLNFTARDELEYIIYVEPTSNYFYFYDQDTNLSIDNATIDITYPSGEKTTKVSNVNGEINFSWVNSSGDLDFGNYTFEFDKLGYNIITFTKEINSSNVPLNESYNISRANLIINIYDRETGLLLNYTNVTLKLLGVFENITSTGIFNYTDLSLISKDYTLQALADGFDTEQQSFSFTNQEDLEINFYLLNTSLSNAGTMFVTSLNEGYFRLQNVQNILQENVAGEWVAVSECYSNSNGECVFSVELGTKLYRVIGYKVIDGILREDRTSEFGEFIDVDNDVKTLVLSSYEAFEVSEVNKLIYDIDYTKAYELEDNNNISTVSVDFYRRDGTAITLCVQYYLLEGVSKTNATVEKCTTASSGTVNLGISYLLNRSNTYSVEVYVKDGQTLLTEIYTKSNEVTEALKDISLLKVVLSVIFLALLGISIRTGNAGFFLFGSIVLSWVYLTFVPSLWNGFGSILITVVGVSAFFIIKDKVIKE